MEEVAFEPLMTGIPEESLKYKPADEEMIFTSVLNELDGLTFKYSVPSGKKFRITELLISGWFRNDTCLFSIEKYGGGLICPLQHLALYCAVGEYKANAVYLNPTEPFIFESGQRLAFNVNAGGGNGEALFFVRGFLFE